MQIMGLAALYPKRKTSTPAPGHKVYPYLLRGMRIDRSNQVWCTDVTYLPMATGFLYLVAVMDWHSRRVLSWRLSNTIDTTLFCVEALTEALEAYGPPEIFNTDQGSTFTAQAFTTVLAEAGVKISMDGRGRWMDNVFIERLWRSVKYEEVYLHAYDNGAAGRAGLDAYFEFYNTRRRHQGLDGLTPDEAYHQREQLPRAALQPRSPPLTARRGLSKRQGPLHTQRTSPGPHPGRAGFTVRVLGEQRLEPPRRVRRLSSLRLRRVPGSCGERSEPVRLRRV